MPRRSPSGAADVTSLLIERLASRPKAAATARSPGEGLSEARVVPLSDYLNDNGQGRARTAEDLGGTFAEARP